MTTYSQTDQQWSNRLFGTIPGLPIGKDGCVITSLGNLSGQNPLQVNTLLLKDNAYQGSLVIWARAALALGLDYHGRSITPLVYPCIACTDHYAARGYPEHWYVLNEDGTIIDPLVGKVIKNPYNIIDVENVTINAMDAQQLAELDYLRGIFAGLGSRSPIYLTPDGTGHMIVAFKSEDQARTFASIPSDQPVPYVPVQSIPNPVI